MDDDTAREIRAAGLKVTLSRVEILHTLGRFHRLTAPQLFPLVEHRVPGITLRSLYNTLSRMERGGLVRRLERPGQSAVFECIAAEAIDERSTLRPFTGSDLLLH